ncbi:rod-binding protein [Sphingomonas sp. RT2P30]|uniref:rod-binding protein n=1 Tax=Parasphingomonas halimpatiens TaxID=3096162 RepID=UPI002FC5CF5D
MPTTPVASGAVRATASPAPSQKVAAAGQTAEKFEAVFLGQMTQLMMESVDVGDQFSGGHGEEMFRGVLAEKLGTAMAHKGGIGLAPAVMAQIIKMQGGSGNGQ